jgi:organic radical activating enzyme
MGADASRYGAFLLEISTMPGKIADISLLNSCNFSCDYCKSGSKPVRQNSAFGAYDIESPLLDFAPLIRFVRTYLDGYILQITGGEPLTVAGIEYLINALAETNKIILCTNGALLKQKIGRIDNGVFFRVSLHPEQRELSAFSEQLDGIPKDRYMVNYMAHPRHIRTGKVFGYVEYLEDFGCNFEVTPFEGMYLDKLYRLFDPIYEGIRTPPVMMGKQQIAVIQPNGRVFPCHGVLDHDKPIGDVYANVLDAEKVCSHRCRMPNDESLCPMYDPIHRILSLTTKGQK